MVGIATPVDGLNFMPFVVSEAYLAESEKYDSSAVTRLRRSDFIAVTYAFDFVLANFGIAIAAKMPMITTTIRSSMSVKPLRSFNMSPFRRWRTNSCECAVRPRIRHQSNARTSQT